jgi:methylated-DNA-protein-cysteine methyltransferase-like protein
MPPSFYDRVYELVKKIPRGKVISYGGIAILLQSPGAARAVGYALNALPKGMVNEVPWQRVINSRGRISIKGDTIRANLQLKLLEQEGIQFDSDGCVDFKVYGWPSVK